MAMKAGGEAAISTESVLAKTGKSWSEWFEILDAWGAMEKGHQLTARYLAQEWQVSAWWSQSVTIRYEQERGLRAPGQRSGGKFTVSVQRTISTSAEQAYQAFADPSALSIWFTESAQADVREGGSYAFSGGDRGKFQIVERPSRLRFSWDNPHRCPGSVVDVTFSPRSDGRVTVRLEHSGIEDESGFLDMKKSWRKAMDSVKAYLETGRGKP